MSLCQNKRCRRHCGQSIGEQVRQVANFGVIAEDGHGESEPEEFTGNDTGCEVHDNWWDEDHWKKLTSSPNRVRSLAEFQDMVRRIRVARGYYPISRSPSFEPNRLEKQWQERRTANSLFVLRQGTVGTKTLAGDRGLQKTAKGPPQRDEEGKGRGTPLRRKHDDSMDIGGDDLCHNGFVEVQKDYLVEYDLQRDVSCAEPSSERHTAHVHATKVSHEV